MAPFDTKQKTLSVHSPHVDESRDDYHTTDTVLDEDQHESSSAREVKAWYLYDWATSAYFYSALNFLPLLITSQALACAKRTYCGDCVDNEWAIDYESRGTCSDQTFTTNASCRAQDAHWSAEVKPEAKYLNFLGASIGYASFPQYCVTFSVLLQIVLFVSLGSFADYGHKRKQLLQLTTLAGAASLGTVIFFAEDRFYWVNGLNLVVSSSLITAALIFYNAYLPLIAASDPQVREYRQTGNHDAAWRHEKEVTHAMSSKGNAMGFAGQLIFLVINFVLTKFVTSDAYLNNRVSLFCCALWVAGFAGLSFFGLRARPGHALPEGVSNVRLSWRNFRRTIRSFAQLRELRTFLGAFFVFSDGMSTVGSAATIFAQEELQMSIVSIGLVLIEVSLCGFLGCYFFLYLHTALGWHAKTILILNLACMTVLPLYAIVALTTPLEFYFMGAIYGFNLGSAQAFTRSLFSQHIPEGREAEYFSFFELSDRGTAWAGPLLCGLVFQATASYRHALSTLIGFFFIGTLVLVRFNPDQALREKQAFDLEVKTVTKGHRAERGSI